MQFLQFVVYHSMHLALSAALCNFYTVFVEFEVGILLSQHHTLQFLDLVDMFDVLFSVEDVVEVTV